MRWMSRRHVPAPVETSFRDVWLLRTPAPAPPCRDCPASKQRPRPAATGRVVRPAPPSHPRSPNALVATRPRRRPRPPQPPCLPPLTVSPRRDIWIRLWRLGVFRFGLMAEVAAAEEVLQHMGPGPRVEETTSAAAEEVLGGDDEEILRFMDSADGYLLLMDSLSSTLRQGWFDLASARHSMGASRVSSTLFDHEEQSAATKVQVDYSADLQPSEPNPHFALSKWCLQEESNSSVIGSAQDSTKPKLRYRGSEAIPDGSSESDAKSSTDVDRSSQVQSARSKALSVFGALVSPKLRTTQVSFETALELIVELANSRSTMLSSFSQIKRKT